MCGIVIQHHTLFILSYKFKYFCKWLHSTILADRNWNFDSSRKWTNKKRAHIYKIMCNVEEVLKIIQVECITLKSNVNYPDWLLIIDPVYHILLYSPLHTNHHCGFWNILKLM